MVNFVFNSSILKLLLAYKILILLFSQLLILIKNCNYKKNVSLTRVASSIFLSSSSNSISLLLLLSSSSLSEFKCSCLSTSCPANFCSSSSLSLFSNSLHSRLSCNSISVNVSCSVPSKNRVNVQFCEYKEVNKQSMQKHCRY